MTHSLYELIWVFIIYSFFGWCLEVVISTIQNGKFSNRGFLNGPFCPIYGFGVVAVLSILAPVRGNLFAFFIGSMLLTTFLEFFVGFVLEKKYNQRWWDYSKEPFNLFGYICLWVSVAWGVACTLMAYLFQPVVDSFIRWLPVEIGNIAIIIIAVVLLVDTIVTLVSLSKLKRKMHRLKEIGERIEKLSDVFGQNLSDSTVSVMKLNEKNKQEIEQLKHKYTTVLNEKIVGYKRIKKAFPQVRLVKFNRASDKTETRAEDK